MNTCKCGNKISRQSTRCRACANRERIYTERTKQLISLSRIGENNPMWKGDKVKYAGLHVWVRRYKKQPKLCEHCNEKPSIDLANKDGIYNRDFNNWEYLCRKCHMIKDGRIKNLKQYKKV